MMSYGEFLFANSVHTGVNALLGLLLAISVVIMLALIITFLPSSRRWVGYLSTFIKVSPAIAYVPLFVSWFGIGSLPKILTAALICFYPMMIEVVKAQEGFPARLRAQAFLLNASEWQRVRYLGGWAYIIQGVSKGLLTSAPLAVIGAIVGDYVAGGTRPGGLGVAIINANQSDILSLMWLIAASTVLGFLFFGAANALFTSLSRRLMLEQG